jgi:hypothetical protein
MNIRKVYAISALTILVLSLSTISILAAVHSMQFGTLSSPSLQSSSTGLSTQGSPGSLSSATSNSFATSRSSSTLECPWVRSNLNSPCGGNSYQNNSETPSNPFSFNAVSAVQFFSNRMTNIGLETGSPVAPTTVYLADDQALSYFALRDIYEGTENSTALYLANVINSSMRQFGGLFSDYYNPVFQVLGNYPLSSTPMNGRDVTVQNDGNYVLLATNFKENANFDYLNFADLTGYYVLYYLHSNDFDMAEQTFSSLSAMWNGHGFADEPFHQSTVYQSYKLAIYLIDWNNLNDASSTHAFAQGYSAIAGKVSAVMSSLQSSQVGSNTEGGVWTGYEFDSSTGSIAYGSNVSSVNCETTSLFALAWYSGN